MAVPSVQGNQGAPPPATDRRPQGEPAIDPSIGRSLLSLNLALSYDGVRPPWQNQGRRTGGSR
jgi:hypothetical protein